MVRLSAANSRINGLISRHRLTSAIVGVGLLATTGLASAAAISHSGKLASASYDMPAANPQPVAVADVKAASTTNTVTPAATAGEVQPTTPGTAPPAKANASAPASQKPSAAAPKPGSANNPVKYRTTPVPNFQPPPQPTTPAVITAIRLTPGAPGCSYGTLYNAYSYVLSIHPGLATKPSLSWDYEYTDDSQPSRSPIMPLFPLYDNPIPTGVVQMSDTVPLHYGFQAATYADYKVRLRAGTVASNWIAVPRNADCR